MSSNGLWDGQDIAPFEYCWDFRSSTVNIIWPILYRTKYWSHQFGAQIVVNPIKLSNFAWVVGIRIEILNLRILNPCVKYIYFQWKYNCPALCFWIRLNYDSRDARRGKMFDIFDVFTDSSKLEYHDEFLFLEIENYCWFTSKCRNHRSGDGLPQ